MHYIIQILVFQILFLSIYDLFLKNETFFQWNRLYLISTSVLAYILPLIKIEQANRYVQENFTPISELLSSPKIYLHEIILNQKTTVYSLENLYYLGFIMSALLFIYKLYLILYKIYTNTIVKQRDYNLVILPNQKTAFSFFNYLFLGESILEKEQHHIITHELIHIREKHSIDLLFFELQKIFFWMNPFSYIFQNRIATLHEYIADDKTIKQQDRISFFEGLLQQSFQIERFSFVNQFYKKSLIKKRIIMATQMKSKEILKLKYLLTIPLLLVMLMYTSCDNDNIASSKIYKYGELDEVPQLKNATTEHSVLNAFSKITFENTALLKKIDHDFTVPFTINAKGELIDFNYDEVPKDYLEEVKKLMPHYTVIAGKKEGKFVDSQFAIIFKSMQGYEDNLKSVPFSKIEQVPTYPGCEDLSNEKAKTCMSKKITKLVSQKFNTDIAQNLDLKPGRKRISIQFMIDKSGRVSDIKCRAPHPALKDEAIRIIKLLPNMQPGKSDGQPVKVRYNLPIVFNVED